MENGSHDVSRRSFLRASTAAATGAAAFTIIKPELVRGSGNEKLKAGLVGCGGRGTEAAQQFLHGNETWNWSPWATSSKTTWKSR